MKIMAKPITDMISNFCIIGSRMSLKIHMLHSRLDKFKDNMEVYSEKQGKRLELERYWTQVSRRALQQAVEVAIVAPNKAVALRTTNSNLLCQKIQILNSWFREGPRVRWTLAKTRAFHQRAEIKLSKQQAAAYKQLGVKAVVRDRHMQWFGCDNETQRCFPRVVGTPSFVLSGRNTPPCCRRNLSRTVHHVLQVLIGAGVRCWLETTSLLGAVANGQLLPWAEYAEVGIYAADVSRVSWLAKGGNKGRVDDNHYLWERATRGRYYRVAYSRKNRIYVLILPFVPKNGTMWPADWVLAHQKEFSERHLHPLAQIHFEGGRVPAPNDARVFLDHKLGGHALERNEKIGPKLLYP
ncbi:Fukutin-related protein [Eumeta japonica]|uniref:Fukutin-related protein n=1 Tax=Eumeta variegata TaxID=151549 RepID=A0A4C1T215_EUMVA|nr:Fukutin-related protein [Eumeta japonica]